MYILGTRETRGKRINKFKSNPTANIYSFIQATFINLFNKKLLASSCVPSTLLVTGDTTILALMEFSLL